MKLIKDFFALVGAVATTMFILGYAYASVPLPKTCTPTLIDRIFK
jgi:cytochrome c oxidase assembly protein Cox11